MPLNYGSGVQNTARKIASRTSTHKEWDAVMAELYNDVPPEGRASLYADSGSGQIHRLKALGGSKQDAADSVPQDTYNDEVQPTTGLRELARKMSGALTGSSSVKGSIHGLGALGAAAGQTGATLASGGASIPFALGLQALGGGTGQAAGGAVADRLGEELVNHLLVQGRTPNGMDANGKPVPGSSSTPTKDASGNLIEPGLQKVHASYQPVEDFEAGAKGALLGGALGTAAGAAKGVASGTGAAPGAIAGLKGFLGIKGPVVSPGNTQALQALGTPEKAKLFAGFGGEPGTSAMVVPPKVSTEAVNGARNVGLEALDQTRKGFDTASQDLVEGATSRVAAEKEAQSAAEKTFDLRNEHARLKSQLQDLHARQGPATEATAEQLADLQKTKGAMASTVSQRVPHALDETTPQGAATRDIIRRTTQSVEDPEQLGSSGWGQFPPVARPEANLLAPSPLGGLPPTARDLITAGGDPTGINAGNATRMMRDLGRKANVPVVDPPVTYAQVPRTPDQVNAAAVSPKAPDLEMPEVQKAALQKQQYLAALADLQKQIGATGSKLDSTFGQLSNAETQELRAKRTAASANQAADPQATQEGLDALDRKRMALQQFAPQSKASPTVETRREPALSWAALFKNAVDGHAFPESDLGGIRAESPEQTDLRATGRLFDTDRFPAGGPTLGPVTGASYGPRQPVSDIFSNPAPTAQDSTVGRLFRSIDNDEELKKERR